MPKKLSLIILVCLLSFCANTTSADSNYEKWSSAQENILKNWDIELIGNDPKSVPPTEINTFAINEFELFWERFTDDYNFQLKHTASPLLIWAAAVDQEIGCLVQEARQYTKKTSTPENAIFARSYLNPQKESNIHKINDGKYSVAVIIDEIMVAYYFDWANGWYLSQIVMEPL